MSRFDKYDPVSGGFRAALNAAISAANAGKVYAVSINASGKIVIGGTTLADIVGVICAVRAMAAGEVIDTMTAGEIVEFTTTGGTASTAGTKYYAHTDGTVDATATAGVLIGRTVGVGRLVVRSSGMGGLAVGNTSIALDDLSDVVITTPSNTEVVKYNGTNWVNAADAT